MDGADTNNKFNHCLVIFYYACVDLKDKSSLGFHSECVYSPISGELVTSSNSQLKNTPAAIPSIGDSGHLYWKRKIGLSNTEMDIVSR